MTSNTRSITQPAAQQGQVADRVRGRLGSIPLTRWLLLTLLLAGVGLRLWLIAINPIDPSSSTADDGDYYRRALRVAVTGQYIDDSWLIRPPGHIFFYALWLRIGVLAGDLQLGLLLVKLAQTAAAAAQIALGYGVARRLFQNPWAGVLFAAFLALWFPFVEQPSLLFSELLYGTLFLAHYWLLLRFDASKRRVDLALSGAALGLAALTRSPALYSLAFVALWLLVRTWMKDEGRRTKLAQNVLRLSFSVFPQLIIVTACCLAIVLPWTARNYVVYQRLIPIDTLGQINLWLDLDTVDQRNVHIEELRSLPQADRAGYALAQARAILAEDPLRSFRNLWPTFRHIWKAQFVEDYYLKESFYDRPLREAAPLGLAGDVFWLVFTAAGLVSLVSPAREGWHNRLFALAWVGYTLFTVVIFHVEPRYLLPLWTLIALYGSGWLAGWFDDEGRRTKDQGRRRGRSRLTPSSFAQLVALIAFALLLLTYRNYPAIIGRGEARERAMRAGDSLFARGNYTEAEERYQAAQDAQPTFLDATVSRGLALLAQGQREKAAAVVDGVERRTAFVVRLVATGGGPEQVAKISFAEATTGLDVQRWAFDRTQPAPAQNVHLGDGRDLGHIAGFSASEADTSGSFRWLTRRGVVRLLLPEQLAATDTVVLRLVAPVLTPLTVTIGGHEQTIMVTPGGWRAYTLPVPREIVGQQELSLALSAPTFIPARLDPSSNDLRQLSVMVSDVSVR